MHPTKELSANLTYRVDSADRLTAVDDAWKEFARYNQGEELAETSVLGRSLWDFIEDRETRHLFGLIVEKVRREAKSVSLPFRCDSPDHRRFLELRLDPLEHGAVQFTSKLVREERRAPVALLDAGTPRSEEMLAICSWCKKVEVPDGWKEIEEAAGIIELFSAAALPKLSHAICPACKEIVDREIDPPHRHNQTR